MAISLSDELNTKLTNIGDAIRTKTGDTGLLTLADMPDAISGISVGGLSLDIFSECDCGTITFTSTQSSMTLNYSLSSVPDVIFIIRPFKDTSTNLCGAVLMKSHVYNDEQYYSRYPIYYPGSLVTTTITSSTAYVSAMPNYSQASITNTSAVIGSGYYKKFTPTDLTESPTVTFSRDTTIYPQYFASGTFYWIVGVY